MRWWTNTPPMSSINRNLSAQSCWFVSSSLRNLANSVTNRIPTHEASNETPQAKNTTLCLKPRGMLESKINQGPAPNPRPYTPFALALPTCAVVVSIEQVAEELRTIAARRQAFSEFPKPSTPTLEAPHVEPGDLVATSGGRPLMKIDTDTYLETSSMRQAPLPAPLKCTSHRRRVFASRRLSPTLTPRRLCRRPTCLMPSETLQRVGIQWSRARTTSSSHIMFVLRSRQACLHHSRQHGR